MTTPDDNFRWTPRRGSATARSVRVDDEWWEKARERAEHDGTTISAVAAIFIEGYARGLINLPTVKVTYNQQEEEK